MPSPSDRLYNREHVWVRLDEDELATIGITAFAQAELGDIVYVEVPPAGTEIEQGSPMGVVESVKTASDLYAPISGTIKERNDRLEDEPEVVNLSPYDEGWMVRVRLSERAELEGLLDAATYDREVAADA